MSIVVAIYRSYQFLTDLFSISVAFLYATERSTTPEDYNFNKENSNENNICTSLKILESLIYRGSEATNSSADSSYHDQVRNDFNKNGVEIELNETVCAEEETAIVISPATSISPQTGILRPSQKKFALLGGVLRKLKKDTKGQGLCVFCKNNGQPDYVYETHRTHDEFGRVVCPHLRIYTCPICKTSGDDAHTVKYCPQKPILTVEDTRIHTVRSSTTTFNYNRPCATTAIPIPHRRTNAMAYGRQHNNFQNYRF